MILEEHKATVVGEAMLSEFRCRDRYATEGLYGVNVKLRKFHFSIDFNGHIACADVKGGNGFTCSIFIFSRLPLAGL